MIKKVVDDLKANREIPKEPVPFIGATLQTMTSDIAQEMGIKNVEDRSRSMSCSDRRRMRRICEPMILL